MSPLAVVVIGALGGIAGAGFLTALLVLPSLLGTGTGRPRGGTVDPITAGSVLSETPSRPPDILQVAATFCQKVATGIFGRSLSPAGQRWAGVAWHLAYGAAWGSLYAVVQASVSLPVPLLVVLLATSIWVVGPGSLVPLMRLMLPPLRQRPATLLFVLAGHLAYAAAVAIVIRLLGGGS